MPFQDVSSSGTCRDCRHRASRLFCNLSEDALARFDRMGILASLPARTTLFSEGDGVAHVFVVCEGRIKLSVGSREGRTMILRIAGPGDVLGLSAAFTDQRHEVTAETIEATQVKSVRRAEFVSFFQEFSEVAQKSAQVTAHEYRAAFLDARRLGVAASAGSKLAELLLEWAGDGAACERAFRMTLTHEELANLCGVTRETVTRMMNKFERDGLIVRKGAVIHLPDMDKLAELAI